MTTDERPIDDQLRLTFPRLLVEDVLAARTRLERDDSPTHRRETIRATFAAIEGLSWIYREHVRFIAGQMGALTPFADLALRERSFNVSDRGEIIEQVRFVTLPTVIRLTVKQTQLIAPQFSLDFSQQGWSDLRQAIEIRHRVTHPKCIADLTITTANMIAIRSAFDWIVAATDAGMEAAIAAFRVHVADLRAVVNGLASGDEDILAAYRRAQDENDIE